MHDEGRRVLAARMRETQLRHVAAHDRRRIGFVGDFHRLGDFGGAELARRRGMRAVDRLEQFAQARAVQRGDAHRFGPVDERQLAREQRFVLLALVVAQPVPLVDRDDQRAPGVEHRAEHAGVLVGHAFDGVEHDHRDLALFDRLQRLEDRELLDRFLDAGPCGAGRRCRSGGTCGRRAPGRRRSNRASCPARRRRSSVPRRGCG